MKKYILVIIFISISVIIPGYFICKGISTGGDLAVINEKISLLQEENALLEKNIAERTSCLNLFNELSDAGYKEIAVNPQSQEVFAYKR